MSYYQRGRNDRFFPQPQPHRQPPPPRMNGQPGPYNGHFANGPGVAPNVQSPLNVSIPYAVAPGYPSPPFVYPPQFSPQVWSNPPSPLGPWMMQPQPRPMGICYQYTYQATNFTFYGPSPYMPAYYNGGAPGAGNPYNNFQGFVSGNEEQDGYPANFPNN